MPGGKAPDGDSYFHGWIYRSFIDPALVPIRELVSHWIPSGSAVIDMGCGTGAQLFALGGHISRGLGVDQSQTQIENARRRAREKNLTHIEFLATDATRLDCIGDWEFDMALTSLVIHEMPEVYRLPLLAEMQRVAPRLILVDWEAPQRGWWRRVSTDAIERMAGGAHYRGFRSFTKNGGIPTLLKQTDLNVIDEQGTSRGTMRLWLCSHASAKS